MNQAPVRDALGVGSRKFVSCSPLVYEAMITDWMQNMEVGIPTLLEDSNVEVAEHFEFEGSTSNDSRFQGVELAI